MLNLVFPKECLGCGKLGTYLCSICRKKLPDPDIDENSLPCRQAGQNILAAVSYQSPLTKKTIRALKYRRAKQIAKPLAMLIFERIPLGNSVSKYVIVPVPLSKKSLRKRGFNQAKLIARNLSDMLDTECLTNVLYKNRHTISQVEIKDRKTRLGNLKDAFSVKNTHLIKNRVVFVVDDVSTTGATINEARRALRLAGAKEVIGVVVAK